MAVLFVGCPSDPARKTAISPTPLPTPATSPLVDPESLPSGQAGRLGRGVFVPVVQHGVETHDKDHVLVRFREDISADRIEGVVANAGGAVETQTEVFSVIRVPRGVGIETMIERLVSSDEVELVEPNLKLGIGAVPNDTFFPGNSASSTDLWGLHNTGQSGGTADADTDAPEGWDLAGVAVGSPWPPAGFAVGVVDTGVDATHPDLSDRVIADCFSALDGSAQLAAGCADDHGHGTHVTGTIAATGNNATGVVGIAPNARVLMCKALAADGTGWTSDIAACVNDIVARRATYGIRVISLSLGGGASSVLEAAVNAAAANGVLVIAAAGNDGNSTIRYPAGYESVVSVGATDRQDKLASFSNTSPKVELSAPGVAVVSTVPRSIVAGGYGVWSGTSMATPHVAGVAALVNWRTGRTGQQLRDTLVAAADDLGVEGRDASFGFGRVNLCKSLGGCGAPRIDSPSPGPTPTPTITPTPSPTPIATPAPAPIQNGTLAGTGFVKRRKSSGVVVTHAGPTRGTSRTGTTGKYAVSLRPGTYKVSAKYGTRTCRAGSPTGPTSKSVGIVSGATKYLDWYC